MDLSPFTLTTRLAPSTSVATVDVSAGSLTIL
jgi:hypothetical protein